MHLQNVEKEFRCESLSMVNMSEQRVKLTWVTIGAMLLTVSFVLPSKGIHRSHPAAVVDRIVDEAFVVLLVGPNELERVFPVDLSGSLPLDLVEGAWGRLEITECWRDPCELPRFVVNLAATRHARLRLLAKLHALRGRGTTTRAVHAVAEDPSSR